MALRTNDRPRLAIVWATPGVSRAIFSTFSHHFDRALQRGRVGQLDVDHQPALVLGGDEPRGDAGEAEARQADQADVDQEHDRAQAEAPAHGLSVGSRRPLEDPVEAPEETAQYPVHRPDQEPARARRRRPRRGGRGRSTRPRPAGCPSGRRAPPRRPHRRPAGPARRPGSASAATPSPARRTGRSSTRAGPPCPGRRARRACGWRRSRPPAPASWSWR